MPTVLIIEDRRENIVFIANNILKPMGCKVITARDGKAGLQKALDDRPDLIITDVKLPGLTGLEVLEHLNAREVYIPAIVMTFHGTEETAVRALRLGARDYLIKPFTFEDMQQAIKRAFRAQPTQSTTDNTQLQARIKALEQRLIQMRSLLEARDKELKHLQKQAANSVDKLDMAEVARRAAAWEEDNARLTKMIGQAKHALGRADYRIKALEEGLAAQRKQTMKYRQEAQRLAGELRNLSEAMRLMAQDMDHQLNRLNAVSPKERGVHN